MAALRIEALQGQQIGNQLDALADLRVTVFRDYPYLYQGSRDYESQYLQVYLRSPRSVAFLVWDGSHCVGASTAIPLQDEGEEVQRPFLNAGYALSRIAYFGESILLPDYRGQGLGVKFFELREAHARALGLSTCAFCAVERQHHHPARPADYVPNDAFWQRRGYIRSASITTTFSWPDLGDSAATDKPMVFWLRELPK